jgi:hypothetical protein
MPRKKQASPIVLFLAGLLFVGMAGSSICISFIDIARQARLIVHGQATPAEILDGAISERRTGKNGNGRRYEVTVTYRFEVDGRQVQSNRVFADKITFRERADAEAVLAHYPPGDGIAYYDPTEPHESCLGRRVSFMPYWGTIFPLLHLSLGFLMILWACRSEKRPLAHLRWLGAILLGVAVVMVTGLVHYLVIGGALDLFVSLTFGIFASIWLGCGWWWSRAYARAQLPGETPTS